MSGQFLDIEMENCPWIVGQRMQMWRGNGNSTLLLFISLEWIWKVFAKVFPIYLTSRRERTGERNKILFLKYTDLLKPTYQLFNEHLSFFPFLSLSDMLCDPTDLIWGDDWPHSPFIRQSPSWGFLGFSSAVRQMPGDLCTAPGSFHCHPYH